MLLLLLPLLVQVAAAAVRPPGAVAAGVSYQFDAGVCLEDQTIIRRGIQLAGDSFTDLFGDPIAGRTSVIVTSSGDATHGGEARGQTIFVRTNSTDWPTRNVISRLQTPTHELFHVRQYDWTDTENPELLHPTWLVEGGAQRMQMVPLADAGYFAASAPHAIVVNNYLDYGISAPPLAQLEERDVFYAGDQQANYLAGAAAVELLIKRNGTGALERYFRALGTADTWQEAFLATFGQTPSQFYRSFSTYAAGLTRLQVRLGPVPIPQEVPACTLTPPRLSLSATEAKVGESVTAALRGFTPGTRVTVSWGSRVLGTVTIASTGRATLSFKVPEASKGARTVIAQTDLLSAREQITVVPSLTLSPRSGEAGARVTVKLHGFARGETITVRWANTADSSTVIARGLTASTSGQASFTFTVPTGTAGTHRVRAAGSGGSGASAPFTLIAAPTAQRATETPAPTATATATATAASVPAVTPTPTPTPETTTPEPTATSTLEPTTGPALEPTIDVTVEPPAVDVTPAAATPGT